MAVMNNRVEENIFVSPSKATRSNSVAKPQLVVPAEPNTRNSVLIPKKFVKPKPIRKENIDHIKQELADINPNEHIIWIGRSSHMIHFYAYSICFLFFWTLIPFLIAYVLYLQTKNTIYVLTEERLRVYSGIFNKRIDDLELYRVKDTAYTQPFLFRFFGLSNIQLFTSDVSWQNSFIPGIENGMKLRETIRRIVEAAREKKGVKEVDYYSNNGSRFPGV